RGGRQCDRIGKNGSGSVPTRSGNLRGISTACMRTTGTVPSGKSLPRKRERAKRRAAPAVREKPQRQSKNRRRRSRGQRNLANRRPGISRASLGQRSSQASSSRQPL